MNMRRVTALTALVSFIVLVVNSIVLYIVPQGRIAYWADWHLWGLTKTEWGDQHIIVGLLFLLAIFLHVYYNWKPITAYLKNKAKQLKGFDLNQSMQRLKKAGVRFENDKQTLKEIAKINKTSPQQVYLAMKPIEEASQSKKILQKGIPSGLGRKTVAEVCQSYGFDQTEALKKLSQKGIKARPGDKMTKLAVKYEKLPIDLYEIMNEATVIPDG